VDDRKHAVAVFTKAGKLLTTNKRFAQAFGRAPKP
jgi:hypothetical protein